MSKELLQNANVLTKPFPIIDPGTDLGAVIAEIYSRAKESHEAIHAQTDADAGGKSINMI